MKADKTLCDKYYYQK